jgi:DHA1 family bicyclomycin/chloramphenicol resistance-like MFS transporter
MPNTSSNKFADIALFLTVAIMYIAVCAEADIYAPSFPDMVKYFNVGEDRIQLILVLNFAGLGFAGLICGPLSDAYGCRKVLLGGLTLFAISSVGCIMAESFPSMIFWRIIQGAGASVPMVVGAAVFLNKYPSEQAGRMIGLLNGVITSAMAGAPIVGGLINNYLGWRVNFIVILALVIISFLGTFFYISEDKEQKTNHVDVAKIFKDYAKILASGRFFSCSLIVLLPFTGIVVYIANLSLVCINHLHIDSKLFPLYQATTMGAFILGSVLSAKLIGSKGIEYTKKFGLYTCLAGAIFLQIVAVYHISSINLICTAMAIFAFGGSMLPGTFGIEALEIFPDIKGTASAMMTAYRQLLALTMVYLSELFFDGTIMPVAIIIVSFLGAAVILYNNTKVKRLQNNIN